MLSQIKLWLYAIGAALLAALGLTSVYFKKKSDKVSAERNTLKATVNAERLRKMIEKQEKRILEENEQKIKKEVKDEKSANNLSNPNDW